MEAGSVLDPQVNKLEQYLQRRCTTARHGRYNKDTKHRGTEAENCRCISSCWCSSIITKHTEIA